MHGCPPAAYGIECVLCRRMKAGRHGRANLLALQIAYRTSVGAAPATLPTGHPAPARRNRARRRCTGCQGGGTAGVGTVAWQWPTLVRPSHWLLVPASAPRTTTKKSTKTRPHSETLPVYSHDEESRGPSEATGRGAEAPGPTEFFGRNSAVALVAERGIAGVPLGEGLHLNASPPDGECQRTRYLTEAYSAWLYLARLTIGPGTASVARSCFAEEGPALGPQLLLPPYFLACLACLPSAQKAVWTSSTSFERPSQDWPLRASRIKWLLMPTNTVPCRNFTAATYSTELRAERNALARGMRSCNRGCFGWDTDECCPLVPHTGSQRSLRPGLPALFL